LSATQQIDNAPQELLYSSATPLFDTAEGCGGDTSTTLPNEVYGHGQIDVAAAFARQAEAAPAEAARGAVNRLLRHKVRE